jgi:hypothetical protein
MVLYHYSKIIITRKGELDRTDEWRHGWTFLDLILCDADGKRGTEMYS